MIQDEDCREEPGAGPREAPQRPRSEGKKQAGQSRLQRSIVRWELERIHPQWRR